MKIRPFRLPTILGALGVTATTLVACCCIAALAQQTRPVQLQLPQEQPLPQQQPQTQQPQAQQPPQTPLWQAQRPGLLARPGPPRFVTPTAYTGEAIEAAIKQAYTHGARVWLNGGDYRVSKTIEITRIGPLIIEGNAMGRLDGWHGAGGVKLIWTGPAGQPMIRQNSMAVTMRNLLLDGRNSASHGVLLWSEPGWGTSRCVVEDVVFSGFTTACYQAGRSEAEGNNDTGHFIRCWFANSTTGFVNAAEQSLIHRFDSCEFGPLGTALDIRRGGGIAVYGGGAADCDLVLRVGAGGHNTGAISIRDYRVELRGYRSKYMRVVEALDSYSMHIVLDGFYMTAAPNEQHPDTEAPLFRIGPGVCLNIRNSLLKQAGRWPIAYVQGDPAPGGRRAILRSENTSWWGDLESIVCKQGAVELVDVPLKEQGKTGTFSRGAE
jgi:hypothetical protein